MESHVANNIILMPIISVELYALLQGSKDLFGIYIKPISFNSKLHKETKWTIQCLGHAPCNGIHNIVTPMT